VEQYNPNNIERIKTGLKNGNPFALKKLYDLHSKKLFFFINAYTRNTLVTEELVQDVFIRLWKNRNNIKAGNSYTSYIYTIAKNLAIDFLRKKEIKPVRFENVNKNELGNFYNAEVEIISIEERTAIYRAIEKLSPRKKEVCKMHWFEKKTYKAIAEELKISVSAVEKNISAALSELRYKLSEKNIP